MKIVPLRHFFPLKVVPLIEVLLYLSILPRGPPRTFKKHAHRSMLEGGLNTVAGE
jgi:hypothetical protein